MIYESSHSGEVTWPSPRYPESFWLLWRIQSSYQYFMFRFRISLKNGFRHKLNHPKQRKSPNPLLIPITYLSHYRFIHIMSYSENFKFPSLDSESHQNLGLNASWTVWIGADHPTCSWCPHYYLWYNRPYLGISHIWACLITAVTLAEMFVNLGPDIFYKLLANTLVALRAGHLTPLINPI